MEGSELEITAGIPRCCAWGRGTGFGSNCRSQSFSLSYTWTPTFAAAASRVRRQKNLTTSCTHSYCQEYFGIKICL